MKFSIIIAALLISWGSTIGQSASTATAGYTTVNDSLSRLKAISKLEKSIVKSERKSASMQAELDQEQVIYYQHLDAADDLERELQEMNLEGLKDRKKMVNKSTAQIKSKNEKKAKSIARKQAEIQKLESEISVLRGEMTLNEGQIKENDSVVSDIDETIANNGLKQKTDELKKMRKALSKDEEKLIERQSEMAGLSTDLELKKKELELLKSPN